MVVRHVSILQYILKETPAVYFDQFEEVMTESVQLC
jgi:hypothetical protein